MLLISFVILEVRDARRSHTRLLAVGPLRDVSVVWAVYNLGIGVVKTAKCLSAKNATTT